MHWSNVESSAKWSETQQTQKKNSNIEECKLMKSLKRMMNDLTKSENQIQNKVWELIYRVQTLWNKCIINEEMMTIKCFIRIKEKLNKLCRKTTLKEQT